MKAKIKYLKESIKNKSEKKSKYFLEKKKSKKKVNKKFLNLRGINTELGTYRKAKETNSKFNLRDFIPGNSSSNRPRSYKKFSISSIFSKKSLLKQKFENSFDKKKKQNLLKSRIPS